MYISQFHLLGSDNVRIEGCDTITGSEGDKVAGGMHGRAQHVLTGSKSVAVDVPDKLSVLLFVLPDAHGCTYPQVTLLVFDDAAYLLAFQRFRMREVLRFVALSVKQIESFFGTDDNIAVLSFADTIRLSVFQNVEPSEILETERFGIETGNSIRGSYP